MATKPQRINFSAGQTNYEYPDFLAIQLQSFGEFFRLYSTPEERKKEGLYQVFQENFPITDARGNYVLEFIDYSIDPPQYTINECIERGLTYGVSLKVKLKLYCTDPEHEDFDTQIQDVFFGQIPYMTERGTFVINGAERVVVSQLHRSPGVFFGQSLHTNGTRIYSARVIPFRGSWIEFATDINNVMYAYIDRKKKIAVTSLLRAIGYESDRDILEIFNLADEVEVTKPSLKKFIGRRLAARVLKSWIEDFVDEDTGEVVSIERNEVIVDREAVLNEEHIDSIMTSGVSSILLHKEDTELDYSIIHNTLQKDPCNSEKEAVMHIYRQLRNSEPPDESTARDVITNLFFSDKRYDLGEVGRYRINRKLSLDTPTETRILTLEDIVEIIKYLVGMVNGRAEMDDIDHLSNRRVRVVGEQMSSLFGVGLARMARVIRERMNVRDDEVFGPMDLVNSKALSLLVSSFFGTSSLSQFMDQTNPLAEVTHKRRMSALGPGGLSRERAGFEVRDVHYTHYGRLCPIETPEGPNIGLISSLCVYAKINELGFITTPYRQVKDGKVDLKNDGILYLTAEDEEAKTIAQANARIDQEGAFQSDRIKARADGDFPVVTKDQVQLMDVAPNQIASIAASLITFLEHDDANRALMGSNMMRQAVPLLCPEAPIVGTGLESEVIKYSRSQFYAEADGVVQEVDAAHISVCYDRTEDDELTSFDEATKTYFLPKYQRTNQGTVIDLSPIVSVGERVKEGQLLTQGFSTQNGELALGRNLKVAFMPWKGYNYEDAIVISERVVRDDIFTSVHVDEYSLDVRETKLGLEEFTPDIPNIGEDATVDLDENGIIRIGADIQPGDILIGKITPKGEFDPSPEEKLLRAIFGEKAGDVKDVSLKASPSLSGTVIDKKLFSRSLAKERRLKLRSNEKSDLEGAFEEEMAALKEALVDKLLTILGKEKVKTVRDYMNTIVINGGRQAKQATLERINYHEIQVHRWTDNERLNGLVSRVIMNYIVRYKQKEAVLKRKIYNLTLGEDLPNGVIRLAKVYIAKKRKLQIGDKLAGRHGNKGIVSRIVAEEDMPFLADGTPVDIVLNPLGVPSRMNLGQIYETVLGWAGKELGLTFSTPIFDGASLKQIDEYTRKANLPEYGCVRLYDGETGEPFDQEGTVGVIYMLKLGHMVEDKMHARSIGTYSLVTQQPLGGKAQFGGQRFGEMEVWALEAFGAANILQEILTVKSDDVEGRTKTYEAIVKGTPMPRPGLPESFNVLLRELEGLCLSVRFEE